MSSHAVSTGNATAAEVVPAIGGTEHATAVEVVAAFGGSILTIEHRGVEPKGRGRTRVLMCTAVACLCVSAFAFWQGIDTARRNRVARIHEIEILKRPAYSVRPQQLSAIYDCLAFGGLLGGVVAFTAALARRKRERSDVRVGNAPGVDIPIESAETFSLVTPSTTGFAFSAPGYETIDPIPADAKLRVEVGNVTLLVSAVGALTSPTCTSRSLDRRIVVYVTGSIAAHFAAWLLLAQLPAEESEVRVELSHLATTPLTAHEDPPPSQPTIERHEHDDERGNTPGMAAPSLAITTPAAARTPRTEASRMSRADALQAARSAGILAATSPSMFASLIAIEGLSRGFDTSGVYGGHELTEMRSGFGYGTSGFGYCGGAHGWGVIGTGRYGTLGYGSGTGDGYGVGGRRVRRSSTSSVPTTTLEQPTFSGEYHYIPYLRRYLRRHLQRILYCYERRLLAVPGLAGTLTTEFVIDPTGMVAAATASGVDEEVANCVADVIKAIEFPRPRGGNAVKVTYPITFRHP